MALNDFSARTTSFLTVVFLLFSSPILQAQTSPTQAPKIVFTDSLHSFGLIPEEGGAVSYRFLFTNQGEAPLVITRVTTDCGCTTSSYTREAVMPGESGHIEVSYDPWRRLGVFSMNIMVYTNATVAPSKLQITGSVTTRGTLDNDTMMPSIGQLQISSRKLAFPAMSAERSQTLSFPLFNMGESPIEVALSSSSPWIELSEKSLRLIAGEGRELYFTARFPLSVEPGFYFEKIAIAVRHESDLVARDTLVIKLPIAPTFTQELRETSPEADFATYYDLGKGLSSDPIQMQVDVENRGKGTLKLYAIHCPSKVISVSVEKTEALMGEKIVLGIRIDTTLLRSFGGVLDEHIDLLFNDPAAPHRRIHVKYEL